MQVEQRKKLADSLILSPFLSFFLFLFFLPPFVSFFLSLFLPLLFSLHRFSPPYFHLSLSLWLNTWLSSCHVVTHMSLIMLAKCHHLIPIMLVSNHDTWPSLCQVSTCYVPHGMCHHAMCHPTPVASKNKKKSASLEFHEFLLGN